MGNMKFMPSNDEKSAYQSTTLMRQDSPKKSKTRFYDDDDEEDGFAAYSLKVEREREADEKRRANYKQLNTSSDQYNEEYVLAKQLKIETKINMNKSTLFEGELAKQVIIRPKTKINKTSSKPKKNKATSSKRSRSPSPSTDVDGILVMKRPTTPPRLDGESEEDYYMRLIQQLANEKLELFARLQQEEEKLKEITNLSLKLKREPKLLKEEDDSDFEFRINKKGKKKKECRRPVVVNEVTEGLKKFIKNKMNGSEIKLLIQKILTTSDLKQGQNRLNMPALQLLANDFLTADEIRIVEEKSVIEIGMLGPNLRMYDKRIDLKIWDMQCSKNYVLKNNWYNFVKEHHKLLKEGTWIQVWSFRVNEKLCLAVVCPDHVEKIHDGEDEVVDVN